MVKVFYKKILLNSLIDSNFKNLNCFEIDHIAVAKLLRKVGTPILKNIDILNQVRVTPCFIDTIKDEQNKAESALFIKMNKLNNIMYIPAISKEAAKTTKLK